MPSPAAREGLDARLRALSAVGPWPWAALTAALALAVYAGSLRNGFVFEDVPAVLHNDAVRGPFSLARIFSADAWGLALGPGTDPDAYRPLTVLTLALDWRLGGGRPWVFHATNAALHALASALVLRFAWGRLSSNVGAVAAGAVFAAHTLHTDAVSPAAGRAEVLTLLAAMAVYALHGRAGRASRAGAALALLAGLLARPSALVALPLVMVRDAREAVPLRAWPARYAGYAASLATVAALRWRSLGAPVDGRARSLHNPLIDAPWTERAVTAVRTFGRAARLTMAPLDLLPDYAPGAIVPSTRLDADVALGAASLAALVGFVAWGWRRKHAVGDAAAWTLLAGVAAVNVPFLLSRPFAERWWYLPSAAACVLFGAGLARARHRFGALPSSAALGVTVAALASLTAARHAVWSSDERLMLDALQVEPRSALAQMTFGEMQIGHGAPLLALRRCHKAAAAMPRWAEPWGCIARASERLGRLDAAAEAYDAMRAREALTVERRVQYVRFLVRRGRRAEAERELERLDREGRWPPRVRELLGRARAALGATSSR
jgi:hypothetical protein